MGFWSTLGKIGLNAAPYVAAPFTGGASLAFAPAANAVANKIGPSNTMIDRIGGMAGNAAGAFRSRGGGMIGNDLPSQGGIGGNMGRMFGSLVPTPQQDAETRRMSQQLPGMLGNIVTGIFGGRGQQGNQSMGGAMNSPYADPNDYGRQAGSGVLQNSGGNAFTRFLGGMFGGGQGTSGVTGGFQPGIQGNASQMGQQLGQTRGGQMGLGPRFDANNPDLAMAIEAGRRQQQRVMFQPQMMPMQPSPAMLRQQGGVM